MRTRPDVRAERRGLLGSQSDLSKDTLMPVASADVIVPRCRKLGPGVRRGLRPARLPLT